VIDDHRLHAEVALDHFLRRHRQRRDDARENDAGDLRAIETGVGEQTLDQQAEFVAGPLAQRRQPPAVEDGRAPKTPRTRPRVSDVDR
jgi:hypothetical protein